MVVQVDVHAGFIYGLSPCPDRPSSITDGEGVGDARASRMWDFSGPDDSFLSGVHASPGVSCTSKLFAYAHVVISRVAFSMPGSCTSSWYSLGHRVVATAHVTSFFLSSRAPCLELWGENPRSDLNYEFCIVPLLKTVFRVFPDLIFRVKTHDLTFK